ncbi:MAG: Ig-like domain-containing protein [bacterium]|nr:Ig-like domain-containing protein [bacterium]
MLLKKRMTLSKLLSLILMVGLFFTISACDKETTATTSPALVPVSSIVVSGAGSATTITEFGGTLLMSAAVLPANASNKAVTWSVINGTGEATISSIGVLSAVSNGTVTVKATSVSTPAINGVRIITISNQEVMVASIGVSSAGDLAVVDSYRGTLQMSANVLPANASNDSVVWSVTNGTGSASISASGLLTALTNGTVVVIATSVSNPTIYGSKTITITNQETLVASIAVSGASDAQVISVFRGTLQMSSLVLPANADDKSVTWSVLNGTGSATISSTGLLSALSNGTVTVRATSVSTPSVVGTKVITLSNQEVLASSITVSGAGSAVTISTFQGTLQMSAVVLPANADNKAVVWSVINGTGSATISASGLLTAVSNGTVNVKATSVSTPSISGSLVITLSNQEVVVSSIVVSGAGSLNVITTFHGTLQMSALVLPANAADKSVVWSVMNGTGSASINSTGLLTAITNGTVTVKATSVSTPSINGTLVITLSNQEILVDSIVVSGAGSSVAISTFHGTLQMSALVLPANAADKSVVWSVIPGTGTASISSAGLLTAITNGTVTVKATSVSTPSINGILLVTLSNQEILVSSIAVSGAGSAVAISTFHGTLQMSAVVLPANAADKSIVWSVVNGTGTASISSSGLLTAITNGTVTVKATSVSTPSINGTLVITLTNQDILVESIVVSGAGSAVAISTFHGTLQMSAAILPANAANKSVVWSVINGTGTASISSAGLLTAITNGTVTVKATSVSTPSINGILLVTLSNQDILVSSIAVSGAGSAVAISTFHGTLQMSALVLPANAADKSVVWSVIPGTGTASISSAGLLTAITNGTVTVKATSVSTPSINGTLVITLSNQDILVESIAVSGADMATVISTYHGTLQMSALVLPANAANKSVVWSVIPGTGTASINSTGLLTAITSGTVIVKATSVSTPSINGTLVITLSNQEILVNSIVVSGAGSAEVITTFRGTLQMSALVLPANANDKSVVWSVVHGTGTASISTSGLLTASSNGTVTVKATSVSTPSINGTLVITLTNQDVLVSSITVTGAGMATVINVDKGTLQMSAAILPIDAENTDVIWSVTNGTGQATINSSGLLSAVLDGTVTVIATSVSTPSVSGSIVITLSNQVVVLLLQPVNLGTADDFAILGKTGISTSPISAITGHIGVSPIDSTAITGFSLILDASGNYSTSTQVNGNVYASDYSAPTPSFMTTVIGDMEIAYADASARTPDFIELHAGDLSGKTLYAGVYKWSTDVIINTNVTLSGSATDVWIFQISGSLSEAAAVQVILSGGALFENVFWQVAGDVAIGASAHFQGTILCKTGIAVGTSATVNGKLFAQTAVTLDANIIVGKAE